MNRLKKIEKMNEDKDLVKLMQEALEILTLTKLELIKLYEKYGYDGAYFNTIIDLNFSVDEKKIQVKQKWKAIHE
jgi:hypothetical protein